MKSLNKLAFIINLKYAAEAEKSAADVWSNIRKEIIGIYTLYVNPNTARPAYSALGKLATIIDEPLSKSIIQLFQEVVENLDDYSLEKLANRLKKISDIIESFLPGGDSALRHKVRSYVHDRADKHSREKIKNELDAVLVKMARPLSKVRSQVEAILQRGELVEISNREPQRKELSDQQWFMFSFTPEAQALGLDDREMLRKILEYPDLKQQLTTIVNAILRGRVSNQVPDFSKEVSEIIKAYNIRKDKDNSALFEEEI